MYDFFSLLEYKEIEEEKMIYYFKKIKEGNSEIRSFIIQNNLRLVVKISRKFIDSNLDEEDLMSVGTIGLIKAVDSFNIDKKIKFVTYAGKCIENEILMYIRKNKNLSNNVSIDEEMFNRNTNEAFTLIDVLQDDNIDIEKEYDEYEICIIIQEILSTLDDRDKKIIELYFGFNNQKPYTQKEIGKMMNLSQSYVTRIIKRTIEDMKKNPKSKELVLTLYN